MNKVIAPGEAGSNNLQTKFKLNTKLSFYSLNCTNAYIGKLRLSERKYSLVPLRYSKFKYIQKNLFAYTLSYCFLYSINSFKYIEYWYERKVIFNVDLFGYKWWLNTTLWFRLFTSPLFSVASNWVHCFCLWQSQPTRCHFATLRVTIAKQWPLSSLRDNWTNLLLPAAIATHAA